MAETTRSGCKIYAREYNIDYLNNIFDGLYMEFAKYSKVGLKEGKNRAFFYCVYCSRDNFSNKMMLKKHKYKDGSPKVTYEDGRPTLLYPYPDFKIGGGKTVELLAKKGKPKTSTFGTGAREDDVFVPEVPAKKSKKTNAQGFSGVKGEGLPITDAVLIRLVLPAVPKSKKEKKAVQELLVDGGSESQEEEEPKSKKGKSLMED